MNGAGQEEVEQLLPNIALLLVNMSLEGLSDRLLSGGKSVAHELAIEHQEEVEKRLDGVLLLLDLEYLQKKTEEERRRRRRRRRSG